MENSRLAQEILPLLSLKNEGEYWDFKLKHHENPVDLVKDIICLANTVRHNGDRYLVFGVDPVTYEVKGIENSEGRRTQADIIDVLRNANFASSCFPDLRMEEIDLVEDSSKSILDILVIKDRPDKPYFLSKEYSKRGTTLNAGTIYARNQDTNTPINGVAPDADIEKMWRERFGLSLTAIERFKIYLNDFGNWKQEDETLYYEIMPEFTIKPDHQDYDLDFNPEWARGEIGSHMDSGNNAYYMVAYYHQTPLYRSIIINFDGGKKRMVAPDYSAYGSGRIYYYLKNSFDYALQKNLANNEGTDHSITLAKISGKYSNTFAIPVFQDEQDLRSFLSFANKPFPGSPETNLDIQNNLFYESLEKHKEYGKSFP